MPETLDVKLLLRAVLIVVLGWWIYQPALHGDWLRDDHTYINQNPLLNDPAGLWKIWLKPGSFIEYYPIEATVLWTQWQLWHNDTFGYHVTNVILHLIGALLFWRLLAKMGLRFAWLGGLIFVIHPVMVESVAWAVELKNTLSMPPFLIMLGCYIDYEEHGRGRDYLLTLGFFLMAMLCKITMAPFPVVMLLYAWWKRGRISRLDLLATIPFFILSVVLGLITIWSGTRYRESQIRPHDFVHIGGFLSHLALGGLSVTFYFLKSIWPAGMLPVYPLWVIDPPTPAQFLPWLILMGMIYWFWTRRESWGRHALLGTGFFLIMLAPFIGFHEISYMRFTWVMDHILYLPILGLIGLAVAGMEQLNRRLSDSLRLYGIGATTLVLAVLAMGSHSYAGEFTDEEALWTYVLQGDPENWLAHGELANALALGGQLPEAFEHYRHALRLKPDSAELHYNLGNALLEAGRYPEAMDEYHKSLHLQPASYENYYNLGNALLQMNRFPEALNEFKKAAQINPRDAFIHSNMGVALAQMGRKTEAAAQFREALRLKPDDPGALTNLGILETTDTSAPGH